MQISRKWLEIEPRYQRDTNRKWHMANRLVTWQITSRDLEKSVLTLKGQFVTPIGLYLGPLSRKCYRYILGYNRAPIGTGTRGIKWSRDRKRHVILNGHWSCWWPRYVWMQISWRASEIALDRCCVLWTLSCYETIRQRQSWQYHGPGAWRLVVGGPGPTRCWLRASCSCWSSKERTMSLWGTERPGESSDSTLRAGRIWSRWLYNTQHNNVSVTLQQFDRFVSALNKQTGDSLLNTEASKQIKQIIIHQNVEGLLKN